MRFVSTRLSKTVLAFTHDLTMTAAAFGLAMVLRTGSLTFGSDVRPSLVGVAVLVAIAAAVYQLFGLYRGVWAYASAQDLVQLTKAVTVVTVAFVLAMFLVNRLEAIPRSVPLIQWFVLLILLGGPRFAYRVMRDRRFALRRTRIGGPRVPVLLVGTDAESELFLRALANDLHAGYEVVGLLDPKRGRIGRAIHGVPVLGGTEDLEDVLDALARRGVRPQRLIIGQASRLIDGALVRALVEQASQRGMTLSRLPALTEFKEMVGEGRIELRPIAVRDLLGRPQAVLDEAAISGLVTGRRVLVTGAGGTIGGELVRQIAALRPAALTLVDASEYNLYAIDLELAETHPGVPRLRRLADVRDRDQIDRLFRAHRPELVFHAAALKHVPLVEENPTEGVLTNAIGTRNVAAACRAAGTRAMVLISTDKAVRPSSVMGATKRLAEAYVQALDRQGDDGAGAAHPDDRPTRFLTVRFGNVLGSSGSVVPLFQRQLARGGPLTVTHPEMCRYFMTVEEAVQLVLHASAHAVSNRARRGEIMVLDMGEPVRIVDLARQMIRLAGLRPEQDVQITFSGLRPGEKLFEEILDPVEAPTRTAADRVFAATPRLIDPAILSRALQELEAAARAGDGDRTATLLATVVPDFRAADTAIKAPA